MADSSRNPGDNENLARLERELRAMRGELSAARQEAEDAIKTEQQAGRRLGEQREELKKERQAGEQAARRVPRPRDVEQSAAKTADAAERKAAAEVQSANAVEKQRLALESSARSHREIYRMGGPTGTGTFGATGGYGRLDPRQYPRPIGPQRGVAFPTGPQQRQIGPGTFIPLGPTGPDVATRYGAFGGIGGPTGAVRGSEGQLAPAQQSRYARTRAQAASEARTETLRQAAGFQRLTPEVEKAATAEAGFTQSLRGSAVAMGLNAQQMARHGALTTEFIAAAARGEVTIRDLGNQVGLTIGKFAGWTVAATAVYGAVGALSAVGRGAIAAASGVELVARSLPEASQQSDHLQQRFAELSQQFNLPIEDVTQAVYGMSKVFGSQGGLPAALKASEQALFAVKVGELDAATSTRYLTGIVGGFKLSAEDLPAVFDAIDQAQNRFGGNTGQIIAGVAKAAGQFRLVGGSYRELIALITAGARITGTTGENVGTAIGRSAASALTPQGQARLKAAGLDPSLQYMQLLAQASEKARGQSRERVQELARALVPAGGQFARVFVPLLQNRQLYNRIFAAISPERAHGAAARELQTALRQPNEQLKVFGNELQQIGAQLARAGAFDLFLVSLRTANEFLHIVERLLNLFNELPKPLRQAAVIMLQIAAAVRLARRFDVGALLPGAAGRALASTPSQRLRRESQIYLGEQRSAFVQQRQAVAGQAFRAQYALGRLAPGTEEYAAQAKVAAALEKERAALEAEIARIDQQRVVVDKGIRGAVARDLAATEALLAQHAIPASAFERRFGTPADAEAATARAAGGAVGARGAPVPTGAIPTGARYGAPELLGSRLGPVERQAQALRQFATESQTLQRIGQRSPLLARTAGTAAAVAGRTLSASAVALRGVGTGLIGLGAGLASLLGPLDVIIATAIAIPLIASHYKEELDKAYAQNDSDFGGDPANAQRAAADLRKKNEGILSKAQDAFARGVNLIDPFGDPATSPAQARRAAARADEAAGRMIAAQQRGGFFLKTQTIVDRYNRAVKQTVGEPMEQIAAARRAIRQLQTGYALTSPEAPAADRERAQQLIRGYREDIVVLLATRSDVRNALSQIHGATELQTFIGEAGAQLQGRARHGADRNKLAQSILKAREQVADGTSTMKDALTNIDAANQAIVTSVSTDLERGLRTAPNAAAAGRLRSTAVNTLRRTLLVPLQGHIKRVRQAAIDQDKAVQRLETQIIAGFQENDPTRYRSENVQGSAAHRAGARLQALRRERDRLIKSRDGNRKRLQQLRAQIQGERDIVEAFARDQASTQFQSELEEFDSGTALAQAQTTDPVAQARILVQRLHQRTQRVRDGYRRHLQSLADVQNAEAREAESLASLASERFQDFQSQQALSGSVFELSHLGDQGALLRNNVGLAQQGLAKAKQLGLSPQQIRSANDAMIQAQIAYGNYRQEQAKAMSEATTEYQLSLTDDPVKQTAIRLQGAIRDQRFARTPAERLQGQANINNLRRDHRNARYQDRYDTIEFEAEMGRITKETEISRLESLLKIIKGNREFRRQIALRIHQLKTEQDEANRVELNVGDIRLPSIYDVRRLAKVGTANQLNVRQNFQIHVDGSNDPKSTADHVFNRFAQVSRAGMRSAQRTRGG